MLVLPKLINDPETKKEMENLNLNKMTSEMPEFSEMLTSWFTRGGPPPKKDEKAKQITSKSNKKRN